MGKVVFYYGNMSSGKTARACMMAFQYEREGAEILCLKPSLDTRDKNKWVSRVKELTRDGVIEFGKHEQLAFLDTFKGEVVLIDEVQFMTKEQIEALFKLSITNDLTIICFGLLTDFRTELFEGSKRLIELGAELHIIQQVDKNHISNCINARIDENGKVLTDGEVVLCGMEESYKAMTLEKYWREIGEIQ